MAELLNRARLDADYNDVPMWIETQLVTEMVEITMVKTADHQVWGGDGPLTYTITITNNNTNPLTNLVFTDTLEIDKIAFTENSVMIDGVATTNYTYNATTGVLTVNVPNLAVGQSVAISFRVTKV